MTRDTVRLDDEELVAAIDERAEELGSRSEAYREAVRRAYLEDTTTDSDDDGATLPKAAREGYEALREHANAGERMAIDTAESIIAQRVQLRKETVRSSVIRKLHGAGWLAVEQGIHQVSVVLHPRTASDGGHNPDDRDADALDDSDTDDVDVDAEFDRLESAEINRGDGVETDGGLPESITELAAGNEADELQCRDCGDSVAREYLDDRLCPGCRLRTTHDGGSATIASATEPRTDGAGERIGVSPLTGIVYAATDYEPAGDGTIVAKSKRPLSRAEIGARLNEVHGPARRYYREHLGGDRDD